MSWLPNIAFDPLVSLVWIAAIVILAILAAALGGISKLRSFLFRTLAALFLALALLNPQTVEEERETLPDEVLVIADKSESAMLGGRDQKIEAIIESLGNALEGAENLEVTLIRSGTNDDGTKLATDMVEALSALPQNRLAGVIAVTDGQVHDIPKNTENLLPEGVPFHAVVLEDPDSRDRRISTIVAPRFGLVGEQTEFEVQVDDPGHEGETAVIQIRVNGELVARFPATIGKRVAIPIKIERRGTNTVELNVVPADNELTLKNNIFVSEISGIRDSMQVLLVTGEPHRGGRAWRNLLKSDPSVEMVHFTILTVPGVKERRALSTELSLISFPTAQLFEEKLDDFDLIIFDHFTRRSSPGRSGRITPLLDPYYVQNIAVYVENGGALLMATGPGYASENSMYRSALAAILPARPTGEVVEYAFRPELTDKGKRHPVTASFDGEQSKNWGQWFRIIESDVASGHVLMKGPGDEPLLIMEKVGDGRVGMLMSDQSWLWSKGYDGGGPYSELFRRMAHWLLGEPDLDAEKLTAVINGDELVIERSTLSDEVGSVEVRKPDQSVEIVELKQVTDGVFRGTGSTAGQGAYLLKSEDISTVTALGALNPKEFSILTPTTDIVKPLADATGGGVFKAADSGDIVSVRRVGKGDKTRGENWMGLVENQQYVTRNSRRKPLAPTLLYFILAVGALALAWRRESQ